MSSSVKLANNVVPLSNYQSFERLSRKSDHVQMPMRFYLFSLSNHTVLHNSQWSSCCSNGSNDVHSLSDSSSSTGSDKRKNTTRTPLTTNEPGLPEANRVFDYSGITHLSRILERLKKYGVSGILSYGLLNTAYYLTAFLVVWLYITPVPGRMGYLAAVERFLKVMAMVWAGSQVTKLVRAGAALALAPFVEKGLSWFTVKYKFESQGKAFMVIVTSCLALALVLFVVVTLLWA